MSLARQFLQEFRPLFRMLEEPLTRSPAYFGGLPARSVFDDPLFQQGRLRPAVDLSEEGQNYIVEADLPGVLKENVEVSVGEGGRSLTIEGKIVSRREAVAPPTDAATSQIEGTSDGPNTGTYVQPRFTSKTGCSRRLFSFTHYGCRAAPRDLGTDLQRTCLYWQHHFHSHRLASSASRRSERDCKIGRRDPHGNDPKGGGQGQLQGACPVIGPPAAGEVTFGLRASEMYHYPVMYYIPLNLCIGSAQ